jgi:PAP2 superfamily
VSRAADPTGELARVTGRRGTRRSDRPVRGLFSLPRGRRDFFGQLAIWLGFAFAYQIARGLADRGSAEALAHARRIVHVEERVGAFFEPDLQRSVVRTGGLLLHAVDWTYWLSQFVVVGLALLWIYLRRNLTYLRVRNTLIVTNTIGLVVYMAMPTAPPAPSSSRTTSACSRSPTGSSGSRTDGSVPPRTGG